jgi:hypothetical protein
MNIAKAGFISEEFSDATGPSVDYGAANKWLTGLRCMALVT